MARYKSLKPHPCGSSDHRVHLCEGAVGTGEKLFAFSYKTLANLFDAKEGTVRQWVKRGKFDPTDLQSVIEFYMSHTQRHGADK